MSLLVSSCPNIVLVHIWHGAAVLGGKACRRTCICLLFLLGSNRNIPHGRVLEGINFTTIAWPNIRPDVTWEVLS
jgi:hypothetical protein